MGYFKIQEDFSNYFIKLKILIVLKLEVNILRLFLRYGDRFFQFEYLWLVFIFDLCNIIFSMFNYCNYSRKKKVNC